MALLPSELARCKAELGFSLLSQNQPYIGTVMIFEQVIAVYMTAGAVTTSSTTVAAREALTPATLTVASGTGFSTGDRVVVDVDDRQESAIARLVSGTALTLDLKLAHAGTYQVTVEGGESIVREYLTRIREVKTEMAQTFGEGELKQVDEVAFYQSKLGLTLFGNLGGQLMYWRDELASVLGIQSMWSMKRAAGARVAVY
jgi:hypothetical protein